MRILLTNDDGVHAAGLKLLERIASQFSDDVWIVAPETDQSGVAHSFSLSSPLRLREIAPKHFAVQGTPTDCVLMAMKRLLADKKPDLILSGVNRGQNVARRRHLFGHHRRGNRGHAAGRPLHRAFAILRRAGGP